MDIVVDKELCVGCGICVEMCPEEVLELRDEIATVVNLDNCIECEACQVNCEYEAIQCECVME